ncbi:hypothetical protein M977_04206, partial [Buttiauxella gaviniae ATCC 51604]
MPDSNQNVASTPDLNAIGSWTKDDYASLSANFISQMTVPQIQQMKHPDWVTGKAISGFTAEHIPVLAVDFYSITGEWLNNLNSTATKAITPDQMTRLTFYNLCNLDKEHLGQLTAAQVAGINDNYQWYSSAWLNNLTTEAFSGIPINKLNQIKLIDLAALNRDHIAVISAENLHQLNDGHLSSLLANQVSAITDLSMLTSNQFSLLNISELPASFFANMNPVQYNGLTAHQISTLSIDQVKVMKHVDEVQASSMVGFTAEQMASIHTEEVTSAKINKLSTAALLALTPDQIAFIGDLNNLDNAHLKALTAAQVNAVEGISTLSSEQFALLNLSGISASAIRGWAVTEYANLTAHQISTFTPEQMNALQHIDWIPTAAASGFTAAQMSSFSNDMLSLLTADQVAAITHLNALTSQQFGKLDISLLSDATISGLSKTEYEGLTAQQIATLTPGQIKAMLHTSW